MSDHVLRDQWALVVADTIVAGSEELYDEARGYSLFASDHWSSVPGDPRRPSAWIWRGSIEITGPGYCGSEPIEADVEYVGDWQPCDAETWALLFWQMGARS